MVDLVLCSRRHIAASKGTMTVKSARLEMPIQVILYSVTVDRHKEYGCKFTINDSCIMHRVQ